MNPLQMIIEGLKPNTSTEFTTTVVVSGILIVLAMLVVLIFIFYAFGKIMTISASKSKAREMKKLEKKMADDKKTAQVKSAPETSSPIAAPAPAVQNGISDEVVAVITAAVAASEGSGAVIRSIKKNNVSGRNPWASAAVINNTRPF